jgi:hypothetical protein
MPHVALRRPPNGIKTMISEYRVRTSGKAFFAGVPYKHNELGDVTIARVECATCSKQGVLNGTIPVIVNGRPNAVWVKPEELKWS